MAKAMAKATGRATAAAGTSRRLRRGLCIPLLCAALSACGASQDADAMLVSGKKYLEAGDGKSAVIQFKNVLQRRPDSAEARYLLGRTLLENGEPAAGRIELRKALALNHPAPLVEPLLARSLLMEGQPQALIEKYAKVELAEPAADAELKTLLARAHLAVGETEQAKLVLRKALSQVPDHAEALLLEARGMAARRQFDAAFAQVERLLEREPGMAQAWQLKGELLLFARDDAPGALQAYRQALSLKKDLIEAHAAIVSIALGRKEPEAAAAQLGQMRALFPGHPQTLYHEAQHALLTQDVKAAKEAVQWLLKATPGDPKALQLAGVVEFKAGALLEAEIHLGKALQLMPELTLARRVLTQTHLRRGQPDKALALVEPMIEKDGADAELLLLAAQALLQRGEPQQARKHLERVLAADPRHLQATMALVELRAREGAAPREVEALLLDAVKRHPSEEPPRLALIELRLRQKDPRQALLAAREAVAAQPDSVPLQEALGRVLLAAGEHPQAISTFARLAALQPDSARAHLQLAGAHLAARDPAAGEDSLKRALSLEPASAQAQQQLAGLYLSSGRVQEARALALAMQKQRGNEALGFRLEGDIEAAAGRWSAAAAAYRAGLKTSEAGVLAARLHGVLAQPGSPPGEANRFADEWLRSHPQDAAFRLHLGSQAMARQDAAQAEVHFLQVLALQPDNAVALNNLASALLKQGKPGATAHAEKASRLLPGQPAILDTLAHSLAQEKQWSRAIELQKQAAELDPGNPALRLGLARIYLEAGHKARAREELDRLRALGEVFPRQAEVEQLLQAL